MRIREKASFSNPHGPTLRARRCQGSCFLRHPLTRLTIIIHPQGDDSVRTPVSGAHGLALPPKRLRIGCPPQRQTPAARSADHPEEPAACERWQRPGEGATIRRPPGTSHPTRGCWDWVAVRVRPDGGPSSQRLFGHGVVHTGGARVRSECPACAPRSGGTTSKEHV